MADDIDERRFTEFPTGSPQNRFVSSSPAAPATSLRQRQIDRRFANQIRDISRDRGLTGTRRRAALALAGAERNAPRSPTAVNRPVVTDSIRLLQDAVNNPRLTGGGRRALITGAAELAGRSDIAEDLTFGRGLRSVRVRPTATTGLGGAVDDDFDAVQDAGSTLRQIQRRGLRQPPAQSLSRFNEFNSLDSEDTFQDDLNDLLNVGGEF